MHPHSHHRHPSDWFFAREEGHDGPHHHRMHREGPGFGPGRFGRGGRGGLGRFFAHGDLRLVILHLIAEKPRHGYEIIKAIEEQVGGAYSPSPGTIYPTLTLLEELGHVTVSEGDGAKKLHTITEEGRAFLEAQRATLDPLLARMAEAARTHGGGPAPQVVRAMENLKLALRLRLSRGPLSTDEINAVAAAIDAAATAVERS
ncbi:PadR family transcriptional regulator [Methylobacterium organophilum]|uniref:PadR family transcriptional regulator n=1 Tax=Methylobacterium organophilum TaxID=410 RepID=UPI001F12E440|nr:PadR family transcriptional regulator [Methylobacterium organophilum]UMY16305.1 PadR family transcriptional regulator [Methylobacterium organophilum]